MKHSDITGIILAGGKSSRMGTDKALIKICGRAMIENAYFLLKDFCDEIIISTNNPGQHSFLNLKMIPDEKPELGPMGGIYSCLKFSETEKNIVIAIDMPFINNGIIQFLIDNAGAGEFVLPINENEKLEPLCAIYSKSVVLYLERMIEENDLKVQNLINLSKTIALPITKDQEFYHTKLFHNLNSSSDMNNLPT